MGYESAQALDDELAVGQPDHGGAAHQPLGQAGDNARPMALLTLSTPTSPSAMWPCSMHRLLSLEPANASALIGRNGAASPRC
jgi:hypothetical protein